jgi:hypothetical protein
MSSRLRKAFSLRLAAAGLWRTRRRFSFAFRTRPVSNARTCPARARGANRWSFSVRNKISHRLFVCLEARFYRREGLTWLRFDSKIQRRVGQRAEVQINHTQKVTMKRSNPLIIPVTMLLLGIALDSFAGSATLSEPRTESLLSAAGFQIRTGPDVQWQVWHARTTPNTLERHIQNGAVVYTYADQRGGFMYIGHQFEYQQYKRLVREVSITKSNLQASQAVGKPWQDWSWTWQPWELWWWSYQQ